MGKPQGNVLWNTRAVYWEPMGKLPREDKGSLEGGT